MTNPRRSAEVAQRWQNRFDEWILATCVLSVAGVALQSFGGGQPLHRLGVAATTASWLLFGSDAAVMLSVSPDPRRWARGHWFEISLLGLTFPLWPLLADSLLVLELLPALTVLEAAKLAKLVKVVFALRPDRAQPRPARWPAAIVVLAAVAVGIAALAH